MKIPRFYLDTSVFGGYFDPEFEKPTRRLFAGCKTGLGVIVVSDIVMDELADAPDQVRQLVAAPTEYAIEMAQDNEEAVALADEYIRVGVVSKNFYNDCRHVALATVICADVLVSWNFRHIVRFDRIKAFNSVNLIRGYGLLDIRSPLEVNLYEE